jgi:RNA polymerase sigma-70 factor (ECF subfamily)
VREQDRLAQRFETHRSHLQAVAYRMLGTHPEAEDAVQEAWIRFSRSDTSAVDNLGGWLTTVVVRVCLDLLRSRTSRREEPAGADLPDLADRARAGSDPEYEAVLADSIGPALLVVLERLSPAERLTLVLHDMFAVPFDEIGAILDRSPDAARQLASRARRKVRGSEPAGATGATDAVRQRAAVDAFLAASRDGDFDALVALLAPDVVIRADPAAQRMGASEEVRGAAVVAESFAARAHAARPALINGVAGAAWVDRGEPRAVFDFTVTEGRIAAIDIIADPGRLRQLDIAVLGD